jgi:hypothetical protein
LVLDTIVLTTTLPFISSTLTEDPTVPEDVQVIFFAEPAVHDSPPLGEVIVIVPAGGVMVSGKSYAVTVSLVTVLVCVAGVVYPFRVTNTVWLPTPMPVRVEGVTWEVSTPSRKIFAPDGVEVMVIEPVSWTRVNAAGAVWPFSTGTIMVAGVTYPLMVTYTL